MKNNNNGTAAAFGSHICSYDLSKGATVTLTLIPGTAYIFPPFVSAPFLHATCVSTLAKFVTMKQDKWP